MLHESLAGLDHALQSSFNRSSNCVKTSRLSSDDPDASLVRGFTGMPARSSSWEQRSSPAGLVTHSGSQPTVLQAFSPDGHTMYVGLTHASSRELLN
jgi:hypothetical protein